MISDASCGPGGFSPDQLMETRLVRRYFARFKWTLILKERPHESEANTRSESDQDVVDSFTGKNTCVLKAEVLIFVVSKSKKVQPQSSVCTKLSDL